MSYKIVITSWLILLE